MGRVVTKGMPIKKVPVNSSMEVRNTKTALAISPGVEIGIVTLRNAFNLEAPTLRAASSNSGGIELKVLAVIQTAKTKPTTRCTKITPDTVPVKPILLNINIKLINTGCWGNARGNKNNIKIIPFKRAGIFSLASEYPAGIAMAIVMITTIIAIPKLNKKAGITFTAPKVRLLVIPKA